MKVVFINHHEWGIDENAFKPLLRLLNKTIETYHGSLNVIFVNDTYIRALNKQYRGKDQATDVLSFNYRNGKKWPDSDLVGEIYISVETASKNVGALLTPGTTMEPAVMDELNKLFVHGCLHIHGYNHETDKEYKKMHALEIDILGKE